MCLTAERTRTAEAEKNRRCKMGRRIGALKRDRASELVRKAPPMLRASKFQGTAPTRLPSLGLTIMVAGGSCQSGVRPSFSRFPARLRHDLGRARIGETGHGQARPGLPRPLRGSRWRLATRQPALRMTGQNLSYSAAEGEHLLI